MKITRVEAIPYAIPYRKPLRFASGEVRVAEHVLVRVHTDDGVVGVADAPPRPFTYGETQAGVDRGRSRASSPRSSSASTCWSASRSTPGSAAPSATRPPSRRSTWRSGTPSASPSASRVTELLGGYTDRMRVSHMLGFDEPAADGRRGRADARHATASRRSR